VAAVSATLDGGSRVVNVAWAATSPATGRFDALVTRSDIEPLDDRFGALRARGEGYLEVRRSEDYPALILGFRGSVAVVQALTSQEATLILEGDGSVPTEFVEVPFMDETAVFSGQAGIGVDHAWDLVQAFLRGRELSELGSWIEL
jgi:hypothetical protein